MNRPAPHLLRMLDAAANRAREALRCLEDVARFVLNDAQLAADLKNIRHELVADVRPLGLADAVACRDTPGDVGTTLKTPDQRDRRNLIAMVNAAFGRSSEALRSLEETAKLIHPGTAEKLEALRYRLYAAAKSVQMAIGQHGRLGSPILCVLLTEALCRHGWLETLDAALAGEADMIQLREKQMAAAEIFRRGRIVVDRCRRLGRIAMINDRADIAIACGAGVHVGQSDMPCSAVRQFAPEEMIVGVSTSCLSEAWQAVRDGASYIGIGPIFSSSTKPKDLLAGVSYAEAISVAQIPIPALAISGITLENIGSLIPLGISSIAVSSAALQAEDPEAACRLLKSALRSNMDPPRR